MLILCDEDWVQQIEVLAFSPAGDSLLASGNRSWLHVWRIGSTEKPQRILQASYALSIAVFDAEFSADGKRIIAACGYRGLCVQGLLPDCAEEMTVEKINCHPIAIAVNSNRDRVIGHSTTQVQCWQIGTRGEIQSLWSRKFTKRWIGRGIAFFPDGTLFAVASRKAVAVNKRETSLLLCDATSGKNRQVVASPVAIVTQMILNPAGDVLVIQGGMEFAVLSTEEITAPAKVIRNHNPRHFTALAFHPSGQYLAATSNDTTVKLYDTSTWQLARTFTWNIGRLRSIAFSPDGMLAAVGSDTGRILVWDVDL
jgi:WD40 repeat protein